MDQNFGTLHPPASLAAGTCSPHRETIKVNLMAQFRHPQPAHQSLEARIGADGVESWIGLHVHYQLPLVEGPCEPLEAPVLVVKREIDERDILSRRLSLRLRDTV